MALASLSQALRFIIAGGFGVMLFCSILYILTEAVGMWYIASAIIASAVNCGSNFLLQKFWAFDRKNTNDIRRQAFKYVIMFASLFLANLILLYALVEYAHLWYVTAQAMVTISLSAISYLVSRRIFAN